MVLKLDDHWIWDSWFVHDGARWHGYFLQAPKSLGDPELRHWNVTQGHAVSDDLVTWEHLGTTFTPSEGPAFDDYTTWTGSVVRGGDRWHLFYTGSCREEEGLYQRIGHAVSDDLHAWERVNGGLCLDFTGPNRDLYEFRHRVGHWHDRAMRDPWVMKDPSGDGWLMYFTARAAGIPDANAAGAIGFATSDDLETWTLEPPVFVGGYGQLEVPQVLEWKGRWYCLFCTAAHHFSAETAAALPGGAVTGNHYLIGDGPRGPWRIGDGFLDGALPCHRYAARLVDLGGTLHIIGFADQRDGSFAGYVMDPVPVDTDPDGHLRIRRG